MQPGDIREFEQGKNRALVISIGVWAERSRPKGPIHIHMTGTQQFHSTVTNQLGSERYHRTLFRNLRRLLVEHGRWQFGKEGVETEEKE